MVLDVNARLLHASANMIKELLVAPGMPSTYLVGGYLRDSVLGRPTSDLDIAVDGDAMGLAKYIANATRGTFFPLGHEREMARVVIRDEGHSAVLQLDIAGIRGDLQHDLSLRDFTINAMALPLADFGLLPEPDLRHVNGIREHIIDPHGGLDDLQAMTLRMVREQAFVDDPIRLLRGPRLMVELDFTLENDTYAAINRKANHILRASSERVRDELLKIFSNPGSLQSLLLLDDLGLLTNIFPDLEAGRGVTQPTEHYWDVLRHNLEAVGAVELVCPNGAADSPVMGLGVTKDAEVVEYFAQELSDTYNNLTFVKLGAMLHDVGKPYTRVVQGDGRIRFLGHGKYGASLARSICDGMHISGRGTRFVTTLVEHHLRPSQMSSVGSRPSARAIYRFFRDTGDAAIGVLFLGLADYLAAKGPRLNADDWRDQMDRVRYILDEGNRRRDRMTERRLVTGDDLIKDLGLMPGPILGKLLDHLEEAQATGLVGTREEALTLVRSLIHVEDCGKE